MQVEENAIDFSWKEVFPDKSDIEERLPSELITLVSLSMASLRLNSFAATTVLGVVADSVPLLDVPLLLAGLSSKVTTSCVSILAPFSTLSKCLDNSPEAKKSSANKSLNLSIRVKGYSLWKVKVLPANIVVHIPGAYTVRLAREVGAL